MYQLQAIPAFSDNYIWLLLNPNNESIIIDPGEALPVISYLTDHNITPLGILLTHHHQDHIAGVPALIQHYPDLPVYGPQEISQYLSLPIHIVSEGVEINLADFDCKVLEVPGHTLGHIAYYSAPYLFCGDTLFSAGCGRVSEGTTEQMFASLNKLAQLPNETLICCAHEYTLNNLKFSHTILPKDNAIRAYLEQVTNLREAGKITLPTTLALEKKINLFLRCSDELLQYKLHTANSIRTFSALRMMKDNF